MQNDLFEPVRRKLRFMLDFLDELSLELPEEKADYLSAPTGKHRAVERLCQLVIEGSIDANCLLVVQSGGNPPTSARDSFKAVHFMKRFLEDNLYRIGRVTILQKLQKYSRALPNKGGTMNMARVINITMPDELFEQVNQHAQRESRPRSAILREALQLYFAVKAEEESARERVYETLKDIHRTVAQSQFSEEEIDARIARGVKAVRTQRKRATAKVVKCQ